jgi:hypothetical protein
MLTEPQNEPKNTKCVYGHQHSEFDSRTPFCIPCIAKWRQDLKPADGKVLAEWWKTHLRERSGEEWTADPSFEASPSPLRKPFQVGLNASPRATRPHDMDFVMLSWHPIS